MEPIRGVGVRAEVQFASFPPLSAASFSSSELPRLVQLQVARVPPAAEEEGWQSALAEASAYFAIRHGGAAGAPLVRACEGRGD